MPNLHDIERRIKSVESTKQITHTMQMVAAAKIRHSTERVEAATALWRGCEGGAGQHRTHGRYYCTARDGA